MVASTKDFNRQSEGNFKFQLFKQESYSIPQNYLLSELSMTFVSFSPSIIDPTKSTLVSLDNNKSGF